METTGAGGAFCVVPRALIEQLCSAGLGAGHLGLLVFLIDRSDCNGLSFWSLGRIGRRFGCSKSTVSRMLADLAFAGIVEKSPRARRDGANSVLEVVVAGYAAFRRQRKLEAIRNLGTGPSRTPEPPALPKRTSCEKQTGKQSDRRPDGMADRQDLREEGGIATPSPFAASVVAGMKRAIAATQRHGNEIQGEPIPKPLSSLGSRRAAPWSEALEREWVMLFGGRTGLHDRPSAPPSEALLKAAIALSNVLKSEQADRLAVRRSAWTEMLTSLGLSFSDPDIGSLVDASGGLDEVALAEFLAAYRRGWKPHWKRPPLPAQVEAMVAAYRAKRPAGATHKEPPPVPPLGEVVMRGLVAGRILDEARRSAARTREFS